MFETICNIACFVSLCRTVEFLDVRVVDPDDDRIIVNAFVNKPLTALRVLTCIGASSFNKEVVLRMVECCPSLEILRGTYVWTRSGNEAQKQRNYLLSSE